MNAPDAAGLLLIGRVMHERVRPVRHRFDYPLFCVRCDLARLAELDAWWFGIDRWAPLGMSTADYGPRDGRDLDVWMRERLADAAIPADGAIWLQTIPRVFGHAFNPVSFWFCHDRAGHLRALYADVRNTFGAHHGYLLSAPDHAPIDAATPLCCRKTFHVSPFCDVAGDYVFRVRQSSGWSRVAIDYRAPDGLLLRTAIGLRAYPLTAGRAIRIALAQPAMALGVVARIHWQALRLWLKRVPFYGRTPPSATLAASPSPRSDHEARS
ncbi:DUF1365 domain-containing protein [Burkholderia alba]|uniref:DUF1365 domain-containing protein n=1 Tax=Burkholderia alba TaxID=2683677 RepID=UPI002B052335|nr:DUF1365 domain-containing protein [Burkholderia alba]